jgi:hypothetical protein
MKSVAELTRAKGEALQAGWLGYPESIHQKCAARYRQVVELPSLRRRGIVRSSRSRPCADGWPSSRSVATDRLVQPHPAGRVTSRPSDAKALASPAMEHRAPLCPRCGAVQDAAAQTEGDGQCPACGLGLFTFAPLTFAEEIPPPSAAEMDARRRRTEERMERERREVVSSLEFSVYGLDQSWRGRRWFGGWGSSNDVLRRVELAHGEAYDETAALLRVATSDSAPRPTRRLRRGAPLVDERPMIRSTVAQTLAQHLWHEGADYSDALRATFAANSVDQWDVCPILVAENEVEFRCLTWRNLWVALGVVDGLVLGVEARNIAPTDVRLVVIDDLEPYLVDTGLPR